MAKEEKTSTTKPTSQVDLENRLDDGYEVASDITNTVTVNPDPHGTEAYVGTDPIYQNHANNTEKPFASQAGVLKAEEKAFKDQFKPKKGDEVVADYGMGGTAVKAVVGGPGVPDVVVGASADVTHK